MCISFQKLASLIFVLALICSLAACSETAEIDIPPLPTFSDETPAISETVSPSPKATEKATRPEPSSEPVEESKPVEESAVPTVEPVGTASPITEPDMPVLTISGQTLPANIVCCNVATLHGIVSTDKGNVTEVNAVLADSNGVVVQSCSFMPMQAQFSLAGTVNAQLQFALLQPGTYYYILSAEADNNGVINRQQLINHSFTVYSSQEQMTLEEANGELAYTAKISLEDSNAAVIWNFLIVYLDNPYGAAGVLANIEVESGCDPRRVQGDFSEGYAFSQMYTQLLDEGNVNRDSFISALPGEGYGSGYGICQWSFDRKAGLYDLAKENECSVSDLDTQCTYLIMELEMNYPELSKFLKTTDDAKKAAREFFYVFEQGAEMGDRAGIAEDFLVRFAS